MGGIRMIDDYEDEHFIEHPMEQVFDLEPGSTAVDTLPSRQTELVTADEYDDKDQEIETQFQEVYDSAMDAFDQQSHDSSMIEPKYRARSQEVAVQFLSAALSAAKEKASLKVHKDKLNVTKIKAKNAGTTNNNLIVADRNDILKHLAGVKNEKK